MHPGNINDEPTAAKPQERSTWPSPASVRLYTGTTIALVALALGALLPNKIGVYCSVTALVASCIFAGYVCARAGLVARGDRRWGWILISIANVIMVSNILVWHAPMIRAGDIVPMTPGSPAVVLTAFTLSCVFLANVCFDADSFHLRLTRVLDVLGFSVASCMLIWSADTAYVWLRPYYTDDGWANISLLVDEIFLTLSVLAVLTSALVSWLRPRYVMRWIALPTSGWTVMAIVAIGGGSLVVTGVLPSTNTYTPLLMISILWPVIAVTRGSLQIDQSAPCRATSLYLPHVALTVAASAAVWEAFLAPDHHPVISIMLVTVVVIVMLRTALSYRQNLKLLDVLEERESTLAYLAYHDELTGLHNRTRFFDVLDEKLSHGDEPVTIVYLDLDGFKAVNDTHGHHGGDFVLIEVARRLTTVLDGSACVARLAGDEFAAVVPPETTTSAIGEDIVKTVSEPIMRGDTALRVTSSVGFATWLPSQPRTTPDLLLGQADEAMYDVKFQGRNDFRVNHRGTMRSPSEDRALSAALREALELGEVCAHLHPIVELPTRKLVGFEALARWNHQGWDVPAIRFVELAERSGLLPKLTEVVAGQVCEALQLWNDRGVGQGLRIGVNIGGYSLRDDKFATWLCDTLWQANITPQQLYVELTETLPIEDLERAASVLSIMRSFGIGVALDDFGTGYNSLSALLSLPLESVKLDRSLVKEVHHDQHRFQAVSAMVGLAHRMGLSIIAEGVETVEQERVLVQLGVDKAQGMLFGEPEPIGVWTARLSKVRTCDAREPRQSIALIDGQSMVKNARRQ